MLRDFPPRSAGSSIFQNVIGMEIGKHPNLITRLPSMAVPGSSNPRAFNHQIVILLSFVHPQQLPQRQSLQSPEGDSETGNDSEKPFVSVGDSKSTVEKSVFSTSAIIRLSISCSISARHDRAL